MEERAQERGGGEGHQKSGTEVIFTATSVVERPTTRAMQLAIEVDEPCAERRRRRAGGDPLHGPCDEECGDTVPVRVEQDRHDLGRRRSGRP